MNDNVRRKLLWCMLVISAFAVLGLVIGIAHTLRKDNEPDLQPPRNSYPSGKKEVGLAARGIIDGLVSLSTLVFYNRDTPGWTDLFDDVGPGSLLGNCNIVGVFNKIPDNLQLQEEALMGRNVFTVKFNSSMQAVAECVLNIIKAENKAWNDSIAASEVAAKNTVLGLGVASVALSCLALVAGLMLIREYFLIPRRNRAEVARLLAAFRDQAAQSALLVQRSHAVPVPQQSLDDLEYPMLMLQRRNGGEVRELLAATRTVVAILKKRGDAALALMLLNQGLELAKQEASTLEIRLKEAKRTESLFTILDGVITRGQSPATHAEVPATHTEVPATAAVWPKFSTFFNLLNLRGSTSQAAVLTPLLDDCADIPESSSVASGSFVLPIASSSYGTFAEALPTDLSAETAGTYSQSKDSMPFAVCAVLFNHAKRQVLKLTAELSAAQQEIARQESEKIALQAQASQAQRQGQGAIAGLLRVARVIAEIEEEQTFIEQSNGIYR